MLASPRDMRESTVYVIATNSPQHSYMNLIMVTLIAFS